MRRLGFAVALLVAGCSDPATSVLRPGQVVVYSGEKETYMFGCRDAIPRIDPGVRLRVGNDPGVETQSDAEFAEELAKMEPAEAARFREHGPRVYAPPSVVSGYRPIAVTVETGPAAGKSGRINRNDLRPID